MARCSDAFLKSTFINQAGPLKYPGTGCVLGVCVCAHPCVRVCVFDTGKIERAEALPYHRLAVPAFPSCLPVCPAATLPQH